MWSDGSCWDLGPGRLAAAAATRAGLLAAALGLTGPLFWFQSSVASSRTTEGYFALLVAFLCWRVRRDDDRAAFWWLPFLLAATAGVRQQAAPFLVPMVLWATARVPIARRLVALLILAGVSLLWALPLLRAVGGLPVYLERSAAQWDSFVVHDTGVFYAASVPEALGRLWGNVGRVALYAFYVAPLGIFALPLALRRGAVRADARGFLAAAALPALAFLCLFHIQQIGHAMTFAPWEVLAIAGGLRALPSRFRAPAALAIAAGLRALPTRIRLPAVAAVLLVNVGWLALGPPRFVGRQLAPTLAALRFNDAYVAALGPLLRQTAPADSTLVIATDSVARLMDFYLPEYHAVTALDRGGGALAFVRHSAEETEPAAENSLRAPDFARTFVVVGRESALERSDDGRRLTIRSRRGESGWTLTAPEGAPFHFEERGVVRLAVARATFPVRLERTGSAVRLIRR